MAIKFSIRRYNAAKIVIMCRTTQSLFQSEYQPEKCRQASRSVSVTGSLGIHGHSLDSVSPPIHIRGLSSHFHSFIAGESLSNLDAFGELFDPTLPFLYTAGTDFPQANYLSCQLTLEMLAHKTETFLQKSFRQIFI